MSAKCPHCGAVHKTQAELEAEDKAARKAAKDGINEALPKAEILPQEGGTKKIKK
jgi:hypothetical protein